MTHEITNRLERAVAQLEAIIEQGKDHETRIRALERFRWLVAGGAGVLGYLVSHLSK